VSLPRPARASRVAVAFVAAAAVAASLVACSSTDDDTATEPTGAGGSGEFPVTITSALGDAVIPEEPTRVATWGWSAQDAVLALGVVPVAMPEYTYGGEDGVLPWVADAIDDLGGEMPTLLSGADTGEPVVEEFVAAKPDVILAPYSGLTQEQFDSLSQVAPVVAYPDEAWATTWQDQTTIIGEALGLQDEAAALVQDATDNIAKLAEENPELDGKTFVYSANNEPEVLNVFRDDDPRVQLLVSLGMDVAPAVEELVPAADADSYFYGLSFENLQQLDSDILVAYFGSQDAVDEFVADPLVAAMPQIQEDRFAPIVGESFVMASSAPTVLSMPWMLDQYVPQLVTVAERVG
jgi:iron complex transport system substrate-binding protein